MYNNSYLGNNQYGANTYNSYGSNFSQYQTPQYMQRPINIQGQQQTQYADVPFLYVGYGTLDEAKAYIVPPTKAVMFIDRDKSQFYIKSADNMGKPNLETFNYSNLDNKPNEVKTNEFDPSEFVKTGDLKDFLTRKDLEGFITRDDIKNLTIEMDKLKKQIEINNIERGDFTNGK